MSCSASTCSLAVAAALLLGCAVAPLPSPTAADAEWAEARWPGHDLAALDRGRDLFVRKCAACHSLPAPAAVPADRWPAVIEDMGREARLGAAEREAILRFLLATGRAGRTPPGKRG